MHKMNAKKSADYCNLIENVKNKYRKNPIYAKNTPHIKYMLIGQDLDRLKGRDKGYDCKCP